MNRRKVFKAISGPLAGMLVTAAVTEPVDNPHPEPRQHEEERQTTYDSPYTTTSMVVMKFPLWDDFSLKSVPVRPMKKK